MTITTAGAATLAYLPHGRRPRPFRADWSTVPAPHPDHPGGPVRALPWPGADAPHAPADTPTDALLGELLRGMSGLTRAVWSHPLEPATGAPAGGVAHQSAGRPAPSGGGLYPVEVQVATRDGLYQYAPLPHALRTVRAGDHRSALLATLTEPPAQPPWLVLVLTTAWWCSGVKYGEYGYRLQQQETGVLAAQAQAVAGALGGTAAVHLAFRDEQVNGLLGLEALRQSATAVLAVDHPARPAARMPGPDRPAAAALVARGAPVAQSHALPDISAVLPVTAALHAAAMVQPPATRPLPEPPEPPPVRGAQSEPVRLPPGVAVPAHGLRARVSAGHGYLREPVPAEALAAVLRAAAGPGGGGVDLSVPIGMCCLVGRVTSVPAGAYWYDRHTGGPDDRLAVVGGPEWTGRLRAGLTNEQTVLSLSECAFALLPVANVRSGLRCHGDRWYRLAQIATGMSLQRAALAAASLGLAARIHSDGSTPTTDRALGLADGPGSTGQSMSMLLVGCGRPGQALHLPLDHRPAPGSSGPLPPKELR
ncbi:SagB family peptide dehydrogenase [Streptomyces sp. NPDC048442]|uniref:SagB family peptide dehydrogenase n=1 Tax=Streptomyces sp. NPDC048442 TaxID=3154823 RepID=UPI00342B1EC0